MPPEALDPVQFCAAQTTMLRSAVDSLSAEVRRLSTVIAELRETRVADSEAVVLSVIERLAHDSAHGKPYWESGADHMGRRWYDLWTRWAGGWVTKIVGVAVLTAALLWYATTQGAHK